MRILVTEDEPRILSFLTRGLEAEGFAVDSAGDGAEALRCAERARYDLVVLDLLLPRIHGLAVLSELRRRCPDLPVVILSARTDLPTKLRGFELGANDYLPKPFSLDELIARIRVQLRRQAPVDANVIEAGGVRLAPRVPRGVLRGPAWPLSLRGRWRPPAPGPPLGGRL